MILWLVYLPLALLVTAVCILTTPLIVLFANEDGELPSFLHYWQTWDDSLDSEYFMTRCVPKWLDYGYYGHYCPYTAEVKGLDFALPRQYSFCMPDAKWTTKQRIQRYICRCLWIWRNPAYGWMFYAFGDDLSDIEWVRKDTDEFLGICGDGVLEPFCYKNEKRICSWLRAKIYLGWKSYPDKIINRRCMYAYRLSVDFI